MYSKNKNKNKRDPYSQSVIKGKENLLMFLHQVAPYNTFYSELEEHMAQVGVDVSVNKWNEPLALGMVDPHDSLSHPAGVSDVQAESATSLDPDQFTNFLVCYSGWKII